MQIAQLSYTTLLTVSALASGFIALLMCVKRTLKGARALAALMLELTIWAGARAMMGSASSLDAQVFWLNVTYLGKLTAPLTFLAFAVRVTDNDRWLTKRNVFWFCIEPALAFFIIWTNQFHYLYHSFYKMIYDNGRPELSWGHGVWFWVSAFYSYALITLAMAILARAFTRAGPYFRAQFGAVLLGSFAPWGGSLYALLVSNATGNHDITPMFFAASGAIFAGAVLKLGLEEILPIARATVVEKISDGVLALDMNGRILDINPAAQKMISAGGNARGGHIQSVCPDWKDVFDRLLDEKESRFELRSKSRASDFYDLVSIPLTDKRGRDNGRLITLRDISERKRFQAKLEKTNARLKAQMKKSDLLRDELREQVIRDPLTGLFNRRYLTETLERELNRARRKGYSVCVIMMDIDQFKRVNDTHGHKEGDRVLKTLGEIVRSHVRGSDIPCRFGGEEFVIVMPETAVEIAAQRADQIRVKFRSAKFFDEQTFPIPTLSIGIAVFPAHGGDFESVLNCADQAMYLAKTARDTVLMYGETPSPTQ